MVVAIDRMERPDGIVGSRYERHSMPGNFDELFRRGRLGGERSLPLGIDLSGNDRLIPYLHQNADGWPRILSRLKTLLETGKTFRPH